MLPIPELSRQPVAADIVPLITNLNPQSPQPLESIELSTTEPEVDVVQGKAVLSESFVQAEIAPRGRPHYSLVHAGYVDDAIAAVTYSCFAREQYGKKGRFLETKFAMNFYREGFWRGVKIALPRRAVSVQQYRVTWACLSHRVGVPLYNRGILRVDVHALTPERDEVLLGSAECHYLRAQAV